MKKIILLLVFAITSVISYSQNFNKVYRASYIKYEGGRWVDDVTRYPENMFLILDGSEVKITNESESKYITYGNPKITKYETHNCSTWSAYDQKGRDWCFRNYYNGNWQSFQTGSNYNRR